MRCDIWVADISGTIFSHIVRTAVDVKHSACSVSDYTELAKTLDAFTFLHRAVNTQEVFI
jgi:flagellar motor switch protein FliM